MPQHHVLLFDRPEPVPVEQIEYRSVEILVGQNLATLRTNPANSLDVNDDRLVTALDALMIINELNAPAGAQAARSADESMYLDVNSDGFLTALDALMVINRLNAATAEGENPADAAAAVAAAVHDTAGPVMSGPVRRIATKASAKQTVRQRPQDDQSVRNSLFAESDIESLIDVAGSDLDDALNDIFDSEA